MDFSIKPQIRVFSSFAAFAEALELGPEDVIFTHKFLHNTFMQSLTTKMMFIEDYGLGEPSDIMVDALLRDINKIHHKRLIAIGGGTVLDCAKLLSVTGATCTEDLFEERIPLVRDKGLIMVPTTCGTGCEVTCVAVVDFPAKGTKMGKRFECSFADQAILIGELVRGLPYDFFLYSSVDALIHALEIYLAPKANAYTDMFCVQAIERILSGYQELAKHGPEKRFDLLDSFLIASNMAGIALANVLCGAVHALAMHFGSAHHVPHGESNARFLAEVLFLYAERYPEGKIADIAALICKCLGITATTKEAFQHMRMLLETLLPQKRLSEYGMRKESCFAYAEKVIATQQRLLVNSYVDLSRDDLAAIYKKLV